MVRLLLLFHHLSTSSQSSYVAATLLLCAFALFACASHSRKWRRQWRACYGYGNCNNGLMGGKCQLPDFSGVIIYDSAGNIVPAAKASLALPWK